jgi:hypothetical protein
MEEVTRVGKVPGGARVGLLPFLGTGVCGCGGLFGGGGEARWVLWWCAPRPGCGLERERSCFERAEESRPGLARCRSTRSL